MPELAAVASYESKTSPANRKPSIDVLGQCGRERQTENQIAEHVEDVCLLFILVTVGYFTKAIDYDQGVGILEVRSPPFDLSVLVAECRSRERVAGDSEVTVGEYCRW